MRQTFYSVHYISLVVSLPAILCLLMSINVSAEIARDDGNQAGMAKAQYLLRQISTEKEALQAENALLKEEVDKRDKKIEVLNNKIAGAKKSLDGSKGMVGKYQEAVVAQRERIVEMHDKFQKLVDKYKELVAALRLVEEERVSLQTEKVAGLRTLDDCAKKNGDLYQVNIELLKQYESKGVWDAMMQKEPVTRLKQVQIENIVEDMQYRIEKLKVEQTVSASLGE